MTNEVFQSADFIAATLTEMGHTAAVSKSTNRHGQHSAYIEIAPRDGLRFPRLRVSDHACNTDYRVNEVDMPLSVTAEFIEQFFKNSTTEAERRAAQVKKEAELEKLRLQEATNFLVSEPSRGGNWGQIRRTRNGGEAIYPVAITKAGFWVQSDQGRATHEGLIDLDALEAALRAQ